jgi:integrase
VATKQVKISDAVIKAQLNNNEITRLKDTRYPLYLRFHKKRESGTWYLRGLVQGKEWHKLAHWPAVPSAMVLKDVPALLLRFAVDAPIVTDNFETLGQLLKWYLERSQNDASLSDDRKRSVKSLLSKHLIPVLKDIPLIQFKKSVLESVLLWPLQKKYKPSTVRQIFQLLKRALSQAVKSGKLNHDPLAGIKFRDIIDALILPKPSKIKKIDEPLIASHVLGSASLLCQLMLLHGTRIGETRKSQWSFIDPNHKTLTLPADVTKTKQHVIYLSDYAFNLLIQAHQNQVKSGYRGDLMFPSSKSRTFIDQNTANELVHEISKGAYTSHDFRKLCRVRWLELGIDSMVAELMLNHELTPVQKTYVESLGLNVGAERRRAAWQLWADHLQAQKLVFENETQPRLYDFSCGA